MRTLRLITILCAQLAVVSVCWAVSNTPQSSQSAILPQSFGGWQMAKAAQSNTNPEAADPTHAALLKEYGFTDFEGVTYTRDDGRKLMIKAARFQDTSGAYGAFTFYKLSDMENVKIGDQGASFNGRVLFYKGNILVDAVFQ